MNRRKGYANQPSRKHSRTVKNNRGEEVLNVAYKPREATLKGHETISLPDTVDEAERLYGDDAIPFEMNLPNGMEDVLNDLREIGNPLIVGGAVRDALVDRENKDMDIEVHGTDMDTLVAGLKKRGYRVDEVGREFGVLKARKGSIDDLDISVPRRENRTGAGHRSFSTEFDSDMTPGEAAERRDFTFNALMYDDRLGCIVDPSGGVDDLQNLTMRHVSLKFAEDPLRVLRGFQFAARYGMHYAPETAEMCKSLRGEYDDLSKERVQEEWGKFYTKGYNYMAGLNALYESGWYDTEPGLADGLNRAGDNLDRLPDMNGNRIIQGAGEIARGIRLTGSDPSDFIAHTVTGKREQQKAVMLSELPEDGPTSDYEVRKMAASLATRKLSMRVAHDTYRLRGDTTGMQAVERASDLGVIDTPENDWVTGADIMSITGRKPGPWMKETIDKYRDWQWSRDVTDRESALSALKSELAG